MSGLYLSSALPTCGNDGKKFRENGAIQANSEAFVLNITNIVRKYKP
jgi:hypothetical protein